MSEAGDVFVMGDVHGQLAKLRLLLRNAGLTNGDDSWAGGTATLWFIGDFCDRGPDGIGVLNLVMRLQHEAAEDGGQIYALLGNHEIMLLAADLFGDQRPGWGGTFHALWSYNGGMESDLLRLSAAHVEWMQQLSALGLQDERLLIHADATFYAQFGPNLQAANTHVRDVLQSDDVQRWSELMEVYFNRLEFLERGREGHRNAELMLSTFGGRQIIHGHTPIPSITHVRPDSVVEPLVYAGGLCINVDGGMFLGGPGFLYRLPPASTLSVTPEGTSSSSPGQPGT
jgi:hypothetical protein